MCFLLSCVPAQCPLHPLHLAVLWPLALLLAPSCLPSLATGAHPFWLTPASLWSVPSVAVGFFPFMQVGSFWAVMRGISFRGAWGSEQMALWADGQGSEKSNRPLGLLAWNAKALN